MLRATGIAGQIEADESFLTIKRDGMRAKINHGAKGDKRIPISSISAVQFKANRLTTGYIQFSLAGSIENRAGLLAGGNDENTVQFNKRQQPEFEAIRDHVEAIIAGRSTSGGAAPSAADEIRKLSELLRDGLLTQEEFDAQKARLLD